MNLQIYVRHAMKVYMEVTINICDTNNSSKLVEMELDGKEGNCQNMSVVTTYICLV